MNFKKVFLLTSVCTAAIGTVNVYATDTAKMSQLSPQKQYDIKDMIISNIDSVFPFNTQITVGKVKQDEQGQVVATNILIMSGGVQNPNISINKLVLKGIKINEKIDNDFNVKIEGLSITNLPTSVANSSLVSAKVDPKDLANDQGLFSIIMNVLGQGIYNLDLNYNNSDKTLKSVLTSSINKKDFFKEDLELDNYDMSGVKIDMDFWATLKQKVMTSKLKDIEFDANFSEILKEVFAKYFEKGYKDTPVLDVSGDLGKSADQFEFKVDSKFGNGSYVRYNTVIGGINLEDSTVGDIVNGADKVLTDAYIQTSEADSKVQLDLEKDSFPKDSPMQKVFKILGEKSINIKIATDHDFKGSNYDTNFSLSANNLLDIDASIDAIVDGKLKLLPYMGKNAQPQSGLYDCKDKLCLTNIDFKFVNNGLLEKAARYINTDPNTTPEQILGSYGALLQLFAVQQKDKFLQQTLSSFAMFLQNPKNISVNVKANKPVNENALINMMVSDAKDLKKNNPIANNGPVDPNKKQNIKLIDDIQKVFKITFGVNK